MGALTEVVATDVGSLSRCSPTRSQLGRPFEMGTRCHKSCKGGRSSRSCQGARITTVPLRVSLECAIPDAPHYIQSYPQMRPTDQVHGSAAGPVLPHTGGDGELPEYFPSGPYPRGTGFSSDEGPWEQSKHTRMPATPLTRFCMVCVVIYCFFWKGLKPSSSYMSDPHSPCTLIPAPR